MGFLLGVLMIPSVSATKRHRYAVFACRAVALVVVIVAYILTAKNFCEWTKKRTIPEPEPESDLGVDVDERRPTGWSTGHFAWHGVRGRSEGGGVGHVQASCGGDMNDRPLTGTRTVKADPVSRY